MSAALQLVLWVGGLHMLGLVCAVVLIIPALRNPPAPPQPPGSGGDGGLHPDHPAPSGEPGGGLPLPDATPARVRLREPGRMADLLPRRQRRPAREPERTPTPVDQ